MTHFSSKHRFQLFLLSSLIFLSSCSTSYHAGRYNHLDWVQKKSEITPSEEAKNKGQQVENISSLSASSESPVIELQRSHPALLKNDQMVNSTVPAKQKSKAYLKVEKKIQAEIAASNFPQKIQSLKHSIHPKSIASLSAAPDRFSGLDPDLRTGIIFIIAGLLLSILWILPWPVGAIFGTIGTIAIVIGLIFILLYLLEV